jgi:putative ABC transport system permease protein
MTALLDTFAMALATLRANPLRSLLTLLGIVIGAATVVTMTSLTEGLRLKVNGDLTLLGAGAFQVNRFPAVTMGHGNRGKYASRRYLTREQGEALRALPHVARVSIEASVSGAHRVSTRERATRQNVSVTGAVPDYEHANGLAIARGRFFSDVDVALGRRVAVIGADLADALFPAADAVGQEIRIRSAQFTVVGVAERMGSILGLESRDAFAVVPLAAFDQAVERVKSHNLVVQATRPEDMPRAMDEVVATLRRLRGVPAGAENDFEVFTNESITGAFNQLAGVVSAATFGLCALALLVGGIGVMNIMLVSVTERTREIGVRMALGARRRRILAQFVVEATVLSLLGGLAGVATGAALASAARALLGVPTSIPAWAVVLSLASAAGCGVIFGVYPAVRASRLDPVEAMRSE